MSFSAFSRAASDSVVTSIAIVPTKIDTLPDTHRADRTARSMGFNGNEVLVIRPALVRISARRPREAGNRTWSEPTDSAFSRSNY